MGLIFIAAAILITLAAGCGKASEQSGSVNNNNAVSSEKTEKQEPITLKFYQFGLALTDADFEKLFVGPVKNKFPYITLQLIRVGTGMQPEDLLTAGEFPDIIFSSNPNIPQLAELGVLADLNPLVKQNNSNLSRFEPVLTDAIKQYAKNGELYALPFSRNYSPLFYNKDIFDKFGVSYPKDGMTWDEVYSLAQKVTRSEGGVNYRGFDYGQAPITTGSILSLPMINPKTGNSDINTDGWKKVFSMLNRMYNIPGNMSDPANFGNLNYSRKEFVDGQLAMLMDKGNGLVPMLQDLELKKKPLNWNMVSSPNFPEALGTEGVVDIHLFEIYSKGKHQGDAFKVIDYLTSKDVGLMASRGGRVTSLNDKDVQKEYGAELTTLKGKNLDAIFKIKPAKLQNPSEYDKIVANHLNAANKSVNQSGVDINTALRTAQEAADKEIQQKMAK
jgi:multiple sugar transport system substrate-binding protein